MANEQHLSNKRPLLFLDVDGVLSLFGFPPAPERLPGPLHWVEGVAHCIPPENGPRLARLAERYELVWATGWEEKAGEYLPHLLHGCLRDLPHLTFDGRAVFGTAHWKLDAIEEHAGDRPAAWIDDSLDDGCLEWAEQRPAPTLVVRTDSAVGLTDDHVEQLLAWADALEEAATPDPVVLARRAFEAANRGDLDALIGFYASDAVFEGRAVGPVFEGRAAIRSMLEDWFGAYEELEFKLEDVRDFGRGVVLAVVVQDGVPAGSAGHVWQREGWVILWERGLIARLATLYTDIDEARAAAEALAASRG